MPSKKRNGLSQREFDKKNQVLSGKKTPVMDTVSAKKAASSSVTKESKSLAKAQSEYLKSLAPSKEEEAALSANNAIVANYDKNAQAIQDPTQNAVASTFVDRQLNRLGSDTDAKTVPLKYQIAALQNAREAKSAVAGAKVKYAGEAYNRKVSAITAEQKMAEKEAKGNKAMTPSQSLAKSNAAYNLRKTDDDQRGFVTLPKGVSGPSAPKELVKKKETLKDKIKAGIKGTN